VKQQKVEPPSKYPAPQMGAAFASTHIKTRLFQRDAGTHVVVIVG
jgi:hypothetical protein